MKKIGITVSDDPNDWNSQPFEPSNRVHSISQELQSARTRHIWIDSVRWEKKEKCWSSKTSSVHSKLGVVQFVSNTQHTIQMLVLLVIYGRIISHTFFAYAVYWVSRCNDEENLSTRCFEALSVRQSWMSVTCNSGNFAEPELPEPHMLFKNWTPHNIYIDVSIAMS